MCWGREVGSDCAGWERTVEAFVRRQCQTLRNLMVTFFHEDEDLSSLGGMKRFEENDAKPCKMTVV